MMTIEGREKKVERTTEYRHGIELEVHYQFSVYDVPWSYSKECCYGYGS